MLFIILLYIGLIVAFVDMHIKLFRTVTSKRYTKAGNIGLVLIMLTGDILMIILIITS